MTMSFGYSIGDFVAIGELALRVYREYRDAPAQFAAISTEVGSLHLVLKDVDSTIKERDLSVEQEADLIQISNGCKGVLTGLDTLLQKYRNVGKKTRWSWDRFKWHQSDIVEMRARVISNTGILNSFNLSLTSSITSRIEKQLIQLRSEIQSGKREGSVITVNSMKAAQGGDENIWREISRELEDAGITEEMINEHREFIAAWVINAINTGQLEEKSDSRPPQGESEVLDNRSDNSERERDKGKAPEEDPHIASDVESERALSEEFDSEGESDEFLNAAAQKIAEFQRLGREAIESSDHLEAERQLLKARDLAVLLFGDNSRKAVDSNSILAEIRPHLPQPIDPSKLDFCRVLYDFTPEDTVSGVDLEVYKGDLVAVLSKSDPEGNPSVWWKCRTRDGRIGYLPEVYLELVRRPGEPAEIKRSGTNGSRESMTSLDVVRSLGLTIADELSSGAGDETPQPSSSFQMSCQPEEDQVTRISHSYDAYGRPIDVEAVSEHEQPLEVDGWDFNEAAQFPDAEINNDDLATGESKGRAADAWLKKVESMSTVLGKNRGVPEYPQVKIAILDTGFSSGSPEWTRVKAYKDFVGSGDHIIGDSRDDNGQVSTERAVHFILNILPEADLFVARVWNGAKDVSHAASLVKAIRHAIFDWKVDIIMIYYSFGYGAEYGSIIQAFLEANAAKILIFSAASNYRDVPERTVNRDICIFSSDGLLTPSRAFNPPAYMPFTPNFCFLGEEVQVPGSSPGRVSGTSIAAFIATAIAALVLDFSSQQDCMEYISPLDRAKIRTVEGMSAIFEAMSVPETLEGYDVVAPWKVLQCSAPDMEDWSDARKRGYICDTIINAMRNLYVRVDKKNPPMTVHHHHPSLERDELLRIVRSSVMQVKYGH